MRTIFVLTALFMSGILATDTGVPSTNPETAVDSSDIFKSRADIGNIDARKADSKRATIPKPKPAGKAPAPAAPKIPAAPKTPASPKTPTAPKTPAAPNSPTAPKNPTKPNPPITNPKSPPKGKTPTPAQNAKPSMTVSYTNKPGSTKSTPTPSAKDCPKQPRKRGIDELDELDSWLGFDPVSNKRMRYVVFG